MHDDPTDDPPVLDRHRCPDCHGEMTTVLRNVRTGRVVWEGPASRNPFETQQAARTAPRRRRRKPW